MLDRVSNLCTFHSCAVFFLMLGAYYYPRFIFHFSMIFLSTFFLPSTQNLSVPRSEEMRACFHSKASTSKICGSGLYINSGNHVTSLSTSCNDVTTKVHRPNALLSLSPAVRSLICVFSCGFALLFSIRSYICTFFIKCKT